MEVNFCTATLNRLSYRTTGEWIFKPKSKYCSFNHFILSASSISCKIPVGRKVFVVVLALPGERVNPIVRRLDRGLVKLRI